MAKKKLPDVIQVTFTDTRDNLWAMHTALYRSFTTAFPKGYIGGAYCPCPLA